MLNHWLHDGTIQLVDEISDWQQALNYCAAPLLKAGIISDDYVSAIIRSHQKLGPYYVLAPGLAMPHARPEEGACEMGLSLLKLRRGVNFGAAEFDPVNVIVMLAAKDSQTHIAMLSSLSELFSSDQALNEIRCATTREEIKKVIELF
ncbi:PTS sugar transporter subunit IIA [Erwiniaceae bacterium CAU 1747]